MRRMHRTRSTIWRTVFVGALGTAGIIVSASPPSEAAEPQAADTARLNDPITDPADTGGLKQAARPGIPKLVSNQTEVLQAGVVGVNEENDTFTQTDISVAAFAEIDDTMYIGGKFTKVEIAATGQRIDQPYLAAFDRSTGAWIDSFRPTLDGNVWDLKATDDGRLLVGGQFSTVNGEPNTTGVAMLDASTGAVDPDWRVNLTLTGSTRWPLARTLDIDNGMVYIGGNFTRIVGSDGIIARVGQIARVELSSGDVDRAFRPNFDGIVFDVDAFAGRVYVAGNFLNVNETWSIGLGVVHSANGALVSGLEPWVRTSVDTTTRSYQQAVLALDDQIWQVGSEHNRQVYRPSDYSLIRSWISFPHGDGQALATGNGVVYSGSHANSETRLYRDAVRFPDLDGATGSQPVQWMAAFSTLTREQLPWVPDIGSLTGEGSWDLFVDSTGCLWTGGDFNRGSLVDGSRRYVQGFAKFCTA